MPNIPVYSSRAPTPQPSQAAISAPLAAGRAWADLAGNVSQAALGIYDKIQENRALEESANLAASIATTQADLDLKWEEAKRNADPNSEDFPNFATNFQDTVANPAIDKLGEGLTTKVVQKQLQEAQAKLRGKYRVQTVIGQSELAAAQAEQNIITLGRVQSDAVYANPATFDISIGIVDHAVKGLIAAGMPREAALELQRTLNGSIAESAFKGAAELNPDKAQRDLDAGRYSEYLTGAKQDELRDYVAQQKRAAEAEKERVKDAEREAKREKAEVAAEDFTSRILLDPTKVSPKEIARDPSLDSVQKRVISNFLDEELRKLKVGGEEENKGPGFWNAYQRVISNGPDRITDPDDIYRMTGPGKPLNLQGANALVSLLKARREGNKKGEFDTERQGAFFKEMHRLIAERPFGGQRSAESESDYFRFQMDKMRQIEEGRAQGKSLEQLLDPKSSDYVGKDYKSYIPQAPVSNYKPLEEEKPRTWVEFFGGLIAGPKFDLKQLDATLKDGDEGRAQGLVALKAAIAAGSTSKTDATAYAIKRGWVRPDEPSAPKPQVAPVMR